ncbi:hypothetical protein A4X03_0g9781 [Tilletia caries]|uniref:Uncharacterized protein n=1 Tax=Tilletia caries TaxID=13290 RepID=A0A8T8S9B2_9BASI|nr:hypothetical protein A4X03_0g9781 [Tilletia caries]
MMKSSSTTPSLAGSPDQVQDRSNDHAGRKIAEDRAQPELAKDRCRNHGAAEQQKGLREKSFARACQWYSPRRPACAAPAYGMHAGLVNGKARTA